MPQTIGSDPIRNAPRACFSNHEIYKLSQYQDPLAEIPGLISASIIMSYALFGSGVTYAAVTGRVSLAVLLLIVRSCEPDQKVSFLVS